MDTTRPRDWSAGEVVRDRYDLTIPVDAPQQGYTVMTGLYLPDTGQRLPVVDEGGQIVGRYGFAPSIRACRRMTWNRLRITRR